MKRHNGGVLIDLKLKRLPRFYERVNIFPSKVLYGLSTIVFLLPVDSGEKMSLAVTILLAQVVTFQTLTDILPASSLNFPQLAYFIFLLTIHLAVVCCLAVISKFESILNKYCNLLRRLFSNQCAQNWKGIHYGKNSAKHHMQQNHETVWSETLQRKRGKTFEIPAIQKRGHRKQFRRGNLRFAKFQCIQKNV